MAKKTTQHQKQHFDYCGGLQPIESTPHTYRVTLSDLSGSPKAPSFRLDAYFLKNSRSIPEHLQGGSPIDHLIWNFLSSAPSHDREAGSVISKNKYIDCLTLWTDDVEFNLLLFGRNDQRTHLRCAYFPNPRDGTCDKHLNYWRKLDWSPDARARFEKVMGEDVLTLRKNDPDRCARIVEKRLPSLVIWNRYIVKKAVSPSGALEELYFTRFHVIGIDVMRKYLRTIHIPTNFLWSSNTMPVAKKPKAAFEKLYRLILQQNSMVAGCGSAMARNLMNLASLLVDPNVRVALVTGEPGTGKEALSKAIYFGDKLGSPPITKEEAVFYQTTALELQAEDHNGLRNALENKRKERLISGKKTRTGKLKRPVIFIDELNKAKPEFLATLLRPLEQGATELGTTGNPKFILAASEHIDTLARTPPQDFWTRITHQLRVIHPLSRVSEKDATEFLESVFYSFWWSLVSRVAKELGGPKAASLGQAYFEIMVGKADTKTFKFQPSLLCDKVRDEFINTLVPLVTRDTLSVRGARSILEQVFARLSWYVRFERPLHLISDKKGNYKFDGPNTGNEIAQLVNSAIQDVLVILNWARATPAAMK